MTAALRNELAARLQCEVRDGEPLAGYSSFRIGGPAAALVFPRSSDDIAGTLRFAGESGTPWLVLGLGSNVLIADRGFDGIVIRMGKGLDGVSREGPQLSRWTVGAGLPTPLLARQSAAVGHAGLHRLIGVPGTVGGGVFMNAGAHGQDFSQVTRAVEVVDDRGDFHTIRGADVAWQYRGSGLERCIVLSATLEFEPADPASTRDELARYLKKRKEGTPFDEPCCGSVFRNPAGGRTAGQLIEAAGLKGFRVGGAEVSPMHANYIVNSGSATAADVRGVMNAVRERVWARFAIELHPEVKLIGFQEE